VDRSVRELRIVLSLPAQAPQAGVEVEAAAHDQICQPPYVLALPLYQGLQHSVHGRWLVLAIAIHHHQPVAAGIEQPLLDGSRQVAAPAGQPDKQGSS